MFFTIDYYFRLFAIILCGAEFSCTIDAKQGQSIHSMYWVAECVFLVKLKAYVIVKNNCWFSLQCCLLLSSPFMIKSEIWLRKIVWSAITGKKRNTIGVISVADNVCYIIVTTLYIRRSFTFLLWS